MAATRPVEDDEVQAGCWKGAEGKSAEDSLQWVPVAHGSDVLSGLTSSPHVELHVGRAGPGFFLSFVGDRGARDASALLCFVASRHEGASRFKARALCSGMQPRGNLSLLHAKGRRSGGELPSASKLCLSRPRRVWVCRREMHLGATCRPNQCLSKPAGPPCNEVRPRASVLERVATSTCALDIERAMRMGYRADFAKASGGVSFEPPDV